MAHITYNSSAMGDKISAISTAYTNFSSAAEQIEQYISNIQAAWSGTDAKNAEIDFNKIRENLTKISNNIVTIKTTLGNVSANMSNNRYIS